MSEKIKVLMVDDEKQFRSTTKKILKRKGFDTILAASGEEALEKLGERPDVVILDIKMPGMDGHQALREIKKHREDLPVIMLTGHGAEASAKSALTEGACDYLSKPCDIDLLAAKIKDAHRHGQRPGPAEEKSVSEAMVPIDEYTSLPGSKTIREAIIALKASFAAKISTSRIMETGHRSILVMDRSGHVQGVLAITDLLEMIMPPYLSAPKPSTADSIQFSPMFWQGMFSKEIEQKADMEIEEVMSPAPLTIDGSASLMEAAFRMHQEMVRRLVVVVSGKVAGIIREQDLFFEMEKILKD